MPGPVALASGVFHLNIRVPSDLVRNVRGSRVSLPIEGTPVSVKVGDKVIVSLRTRDIAIAKARFTAAAAALAAHWAAARAGPKALSHREIVALAGDAYRNRMAQLDIKFDPDGHVARGRELIAATVAAPAKPAPEEPVDPASSNPRRPCPCCGGRMIIIETFERSCQPRAPASLERDGQLGFGFSCHAPNHPSGNCAIHAAATSSCNLSA